MNFEIGQVVFVSVFNRLRRHKPYCKPYKIVQISNGTIAATPIHYEEYPKMWMRFGSKNLKYVNRRTKFEYRIFTTIEVFEHAVCDGEFN